MANIRKIALVECKGRGLVNIYRFMPMPRGIPLLAAELSLLGYEVDCYVELLKKFDWKRLLDYDLVGFSCISCTVLPSFEMARRLKAAGYTGKIVFGGPHPTALPEESLTHGADIVCRGEGDLTLPELLNALRDGSRLDQILGISWKNPAGRIIHNPDRPFLSEEELSKLPFPALDRVFGIERMMQIPIPLSRGCGKACKFCAVRRMFGGQHRCPCVEWRLNQLRILRDEYPELWERCCLFFTDDDFFGNEEEAVIADLMLERMIEEGLVPPKDFVLQMRVEMATPERCKLIRRAGGAIVCLGLESANPKTLKEIRKQQTPDQIKEGLKNLKDAGIEVMAMTIVGAENDTFWSVFGSIRQLVRWGITYLQLLGMVPLPGTELTAWLISEGRTFCRNYDRYDGQHGLASTDKMSDREIGASIYLISGWFYFLTPQGISLLLRYPRQFVGMVFMTVLSWLGNDKR